MARFERKYVSEDGPKSDQNGSQPTANPRENLAIPFLSEKAPQSTQGGLPACANVNNKPINRPRQHDSRGTHMTNLVLFNRVSGAVLRRNLAEVFHQITANDAKADCSHVLLAGILVVEESDHSACCRSETAGVRAASSPSA